MKVGDILYRFDINRRVYESDKIVYRGHFAPFPIADETRDSWLLGNWKVKVNKKTLKEAGRNGFMGYQWFTHEGMENNIWAHQHRYPILELVRVADGTTLRKIADVLGYQA